MASRASLVTTTLGRPCSFAVRTTSSIPGDLPDCETANTAGAVDVHGAPVLEERRRRQCDDQSEFAPGEVLKERRRVVRGSSRGDEGVVDLAPRERGIVGLL